VRNPGLAHAKHWWSQRLADGSDTRSFEEVFRATEPRFLHLTLTWLDHPTRTLPVTKLAELADAAQTRLGELDPVTVSVGPGLVGYYALELYVTPDPALDALAAAARVAIRDVFGPAAATEPSPVQPWVPHIAVLYGTAPADTDGLASRILYTPPPGHTDLSRPVPMDIAHVLVAEQDTWGPDGLTWDQVSARKISLRP
jgi:hypothetical protein